MKAFRVTQFAGGPCTHPGCTSCPDHPLSINLVPVVEDRAPISVSITPGARYLTVEDADMVDPSEVGA